MGIRLSANNYGKSRVRMVQVVRGRERNHLKDISVNIQFSGDFDAAHIKWDNRKILPTDTMKNTVYALAAECPADPIEDFASKLSRHFLRNNPQLASVRVEITENLWTSILIGKKLHPTSFMRAGQEKRTTAVIATCSQLRIESGIDDLLVMKTANSAFDGFLRDAFTTLPETRDRLLATVVRAAWRYRGDRAPFDACWIQVRETILAVFAQHKSESVQHTLYAMGEAVLKRQKAIDEIRFSLPNKHCLLVDLSRFGLRNNNEIFVPMDEPHGLIEATLRRT